MATVIQAATTFGLTKTVSVAAFGAWREFVLFAGLTGVLHAGFADGLQVLWCRKRDDVSQHVLPWALKLMILAHLGWLALAVAMSIAFPFLESFPFFLTVVVLYALLWNSSTVVQYHLQCTGRFLQLGWFTVAFPGTFFFIALTLVLTRGATAFNLALGYCAAVAIASLLILFRARQETNTNPSRAPDLQYAAQVTRLGVPILVLNYSVLGILNFDKIAASLLFTAAPFALYGFAAALLSVINSMILGGARVMLPGLAEHAAAGSLSSATRSAVRVICLVWATLLVSYFPIAMAVETYLPKYTSALPMTRVFFVGTIFLALPQIVHLNACRALQIEREYLTSSLGILCLAMPAALLCGRLGGMQTLPVLSAGVGILWTVRGTQLLRTHNILSYDTFTVVTIAWAITAFLFASSGERLTLDGVLYLCGVVPLWLMWSRQSARQH